MIRFTKHAQEAISIRDITIDWIEYGARVLRVVHRPEGDDIVIITVHFDRGARR